ncbi:uncharacterized protein LOC135955607 [Calliphora vicina]|uniref:uncharacterized protein LOC135955607 n=1 Tax=Calliphora vicina TaxID=7373 RepID=UPI00325C328A
METSTTKSTERWIIFNRPNCASCASATTKRNCKQFKRMTLRQRQYVVRVHRYCTNCFARTHLVGGCISTDGCQICGDLHHTMLHPQSVRDRLSQPQTQQQQPLRQRRQQQQPLRQRLQQPQRQRRQQQQKPQRQRRQPQQQHGQ